MTKSLTYVEVDVPAWSQSSPDSPATELTFRFAVDTNYLPADIDCIPSIKDVKIAPAIVGLGSDLGQRASVTVTFKDHRHVFAGENFTSGTFWGKWRARYGLTLRAHPLRLIRGTLGQTLEEMETRAFAIEASDGPNAVGEYKIVAKDILKYADGDRAQAPRLSNGFLLAGITNVATSATLSPTGIGNSEYPASGILSIGGNEMCSFTRSGDVLTLTRGFSNTPQAHNAGDRVQVTLRYSGQTVADIIYDLLTTYADVPASYITLSEWTTEVNSYLGVNFTGAVVEPTSVSKLIAELIEQASLAIWWDDVNQQIRLQVLRAVVGASTIDMEMIMAGSLEITEQPDKRLSQVYVYFGQIDPLLNLDRIDNYRSTALRQDEDAEIEYSGVAIKKIFSRWIPAGGRTTAELIANKHLGRFRDPPRRFNFDLMRYAQNDPQLGAGYFLESWQLQDTSGNADSVPIQIFRLNPGADRFEVEAEEMLWTPYGGDIDPGTRAIIFDAPENNINLRTRHDQLYPTPVSGNVVNATINASVVIGSSNTGSPAFDIGTWPAGVDVNLTVNGRIQGAGGSGGQGGSCFSNSSGSGGSSGSVGGPALYTRQAITLTSTAGAIWGGGGGGGGGGIAASSSQDTQNPGGGGGGGAGYSTAGSGAAAGGVNSGVGSTTYTANPGSAGSTTGGGSGGTAQTSFAGATGGTGGAGGGPGLSGSSGGNGSGASVTTDGGSGGANGAAIDGGSFVTQVGGAGDHRGGSIN